MNIVVNSRFNPFTYEQLVKPLEDYTKVYNEVGEQYAGLADQTELLRNVVSGEPESQAFKTFHKYSDELNRVVDDFSKGMTSSNRGALLGLRRRYSKDIKPISEAVKRKTALAEEQRKAELANPTMLWERRADEISLDDFINNPSADYGRSTSGAALSAQVAAGAGALAKEFRDNPEKMKKLVGGDYYEYVKQRGFSSEAVLAAIMNNPEASPVLTQLVESAIDSAGLREWANPDTLKQAYNYARQGLWNAVGQDETQLVQNWRAQENLRQANTLELKKKEIEIAADKMKPREIIGADGKPSGSFYDPSIGMVTDKNGNIIGSTSDDGSISINKVGTGKKEDTRIAADPVVDESRALKLSDFAKARTKADIEDLGYNIVSIVTNHRGTWQWGKPGDDLGSGNRAIHYSNGTPQYVNPERPEMGYATVSGKSDPIGWTESNLVSKFGYLTSTPTDKKKYEYLDEMQYERLKDDKELFRALNQAAFEAGYSDFQVYRVPNTSSTLFGSKEPGYSYAIVGK